MGALIPSVEMIEATLDQAWKQGCERHDTRPGRRIYAEAIRELYAPLITEGVGLHIQILEQRNTLAAVAEAMLEVSRCAGVKPHLRTLAAELAKAIQTEKSADKADDEGDGDVLAGIKP